jgi:hypothetical protein
MRSYLGDVVLASYARENCCCCGCSGLSGRSASRDGPASHLHDKRDGTVPLSPGPRPSYIERLDATAPVTQEQDGLVASR